MHQNDLPHWQQGEAWIFVTFRLGDSLPEEKLKQWRFERDQWMAEHPEPWDEQTVWDYHQKFTEQLEMWLDAGEGSCALRDPEVRILVENALFFFHGERYDLDCYVIMPNHAHVLFRPKNDHALSRILHSWKSYTGNVINKKIGKTGSFWQEDYWDRLVRSEKHMNHCRRYIAENPVKAGLREGEYTLWGV
ncbi:MAG: transposase [Kiritimatiellae bacterium]|nr:transposase [Kiritimatiellia bacterium]